MCMTYNYVIMLVKLLQTIIHTEIISTADNRACAAINNPSVSKVKSPLVSYYMLANSYTFLSRDLTK